MIWDAPISPRDLFERLVHMEKEIERWKARVAELERKSKAHLTWSDLPDATSGR